MYHYDLETALEELDEEALLPHPVRVRDLIMRAGLAPDRAADVNRTFQQYLHQFGETQKVGRSVLEKLLNAKS